MVNDQNTGPRSMNCRGVGDEIIPLLLGCSVIYSFNFGMTLW